MVTQRELAQRQRRLREHKRDSQIPLHTDLQLSISRNISLNTRQYISEAHAMQLDQIKLPYHGHFNRRQYAQQNRQSREYLLRQIQLPLARRSLLPEIISSRHKLDSCDIICSFCRARHWIEERIHGSTITSPQFSTCCLKGTILMDKFDDPSEPLYSLLTQSNSGKTF